MNELVFLFHSTLLGLSTIIAHRIGKEALIGLVCTCWVLANLMVVKQVTLFGLPVTAADAYSVGATLGLNVLQEYWGRTITKKTIYASFMCSAIYLAMTLVHRAYAPNQFDTTHFHFDAILHYSPRIIIASMITYLIVQHLDYWLYGTLKRRYEHRFLLLRNYVSIGTTQLIDTILFSYLGLYGIVASLSSVIFFSYAIKLCAIVFCGPFIQCIRHTYRETHE